MQDKNLKSHSLGNNGAMSDWSMEKIDVNHVEYIQTYLGCIGFTGGK